MRVTGNSLAISLTAFMVCTTQGVVAQEIVNPGFENGWAGWTDVDPNKDATSISGHFLNGAKSAKITKETGRFEQKARLYAGSDYELVVHIKGPGTVGIEIGGETLSASSDGNGEEWIPVTVPFSTGDAEDGLVFGIHNGDEGRFDDVTFVALSGPALEAAEARAAGPRIYTTIPGGCDRMSQLGIKSVSDDGTSEDIHGPELAIDHSFDPESRWSSKEPGKELILDMGLPHTIKEIGIAWYKGNVRKSLFEMSTSMDGKKFTRMIERAESGGETTAIERYDHDDTIARFVKITGQGNFDNAWNSIVEVQLFGCGLREIESTGDGSETAEIKGVSPLGLKTGVAPSENFDLAAWKITTPKDADGDGRADEIKEAALAGGFADRDVFYTDPVSGGMVFRATTGATTPNSKYPRSELRGMLRAGDESISTRGGSDGPSQNNWVFSSAPIETQKLSGGVDGVLTATLSVDQVTRIGDPAKVGRVVIGQIHAKDDEPIRLYYRKLPFNLRGAIYYAHEVKSGDDTWVEVIGARGDRAADDPNGILLGETFSYEIKVVGDVLDVAITRADGSVVAAPSLDMSASGYGVADEFMFFKAGAYSQNNTTTWPARDFDQVTFYALEATHGAVPK